MRKPVLFVLLAVTGSVICVSDAEARCGRGNCGGRVSTYAAAPATCGCSNASTVTSPSTVTPAPQPVSAAPQPGASSSYQSYSYEPGASQADQSSSQPIPVISSTMNAVGVRIGQPTVMYTRHHAWSEYDSVLRGNKKTQPQP